jgi:hypothetical protein
MYSEGELELIVHHFRKPVKPAQMTELSDIKSPPNDVLMSYLAARMCRKGLARMMQDMKEFESALRSAKPESIQEQELPKLQFCMSYLEGPVYVSRMLRQVTDKFAAGHGDAMIVAEAYDNEYRFPSGHTARFFMLYNEKTANMPIFDMAMSLLGTGEIYLRETSFAAMLAYLDAIRGTPGFTESEIPTSFEKDVRGISIAHEICEMSLLRAGANAGDIELAAERASREFLEQNGVNPKSYILFHRLRAGKHTANGKNYSLLITEGL